jgi:pimeloyl-ACP methyl ester carboxylesterase
MNIELKHNQLIGGRSVDLLKYTTIKPTNKWMWFLPGTGELGPADGSQIGDMLKYGYQRFPGFETEFNVLAAQANTSYSEFDQTILPWMENELGADQILIVGHSLGARKVIELVTKYKGRKVTDKVVGFVPIAGAISGSTPIWSDCYDLPVTAFHGELDNDIGWVQSDKFIKGLNSYTERKHKAVFRKIPAYNHTSIMNYVFTPSVEHEGYKTFRGMFNWSSAVVDCQAQLDETNLKATFFLPNGPVNYNLIKP